MTPEYRIETEKSITSYLKSQGVEKIIYMQVEQTYHDLGVEINVWNIKAEKMHRWTLADQES